MVGVYRKPPPPRRRVRAIFGPHFNNSRAERAPWIRPRAPYFIHRTPSPFRLTFGPHFEDSLAHRVHYRRERVRLRPTLIRVRSHILHLIGGPVVVILARLRMLRGVGR